MRDGFVVIVVGEIYGPGSQIEREIVRRRCGFGQYLFLRRLRVSFVSPAGFERLDVFINFAAHIIIELPVEIGFRKFQSLREDFRRLFLFLVAAQHFENRVEPEALIDEVANLRGLEIGQSNVVGPFGTDESIVQIGDREPSVIGEGLDVLDAPIVAPARTSIVFFVDAQTF